MVIVLSLLLVAVLALYFLTVKVFFNTFKSVFNSQSKTDDDELTAYDGCYYLCTLYLDVQPRSEEDMAEITQVFNFSFYESHNIVFCLMISDELAKQTSGLRVVPNAIVFQVAEGVWAWKY